MDFRPPRRKARAFINVTSLIDVLFLLLIFFMVSSTFKQQPAIKLVLPESASAEGTETGPSVLYLSQAGEIFLDDEALAEDEVLPALRRRQAESGETRIILRADQQSQHGEVVRLIDRVKEAGFSQISLSARRPATP